MATRDYGDPPARTAGAPQGIVILAASVLPVMGVVLISPVASLLKSAFAHYPGGAYLAGAALTAPALAIAVCSPFIGAFIDRFGSRRVLIAALFTYAAVGMAPIWLDSLSAILAMRLMLGVTEAAIYTTAFALIAGYFADAQRTRWLAYKTAAAGLGGTGFYMLGGALGEISWRAPFAAYGVSLLVALAATRLIFEPARPSRFQDAIAPSPQGTLFSSLALCVLTALSAISFYIVPIQFSVLLGEVGVVSPALLGVMIAVAGLGYPVGAVAYRFVAGVPAALLTAIAGSLSAIGLGIAATARTPVAMVAGALLHQVGSGAFVPLIQVAMMRILPANRRGLGGGGWVTSFFAGQFLCPLVTAAAIDLSGGVRSGFGVLAAFVLAFAIAGALTFGVILRGPSRSAIPVRRQADF